MSFSLFITLPPRVRDRIQFLRMEIFFFLFFFRCWWGFFSPRKVMEGVWVGVCRVAVTAGTAYSWSFCFLSICTVWLSLWAFGAFFPPHLRLSVDQRFYPSWLQHASICCLRIVFNTLATIRKQYRPLLGCWHERTIGVTIAVRNSADISWQSS